MDRPWRKFPNNRNLLYAFAILIAIPIPITIHRGISEFLHPSPAWMTGPRWYDHILQAGLSSTLFILCFIYDRRRLRQERDEAIDPLASRRRPRGRPELRLALYAYTICFAVSIPLAFLAAYRAAADSTFPTTLWSAFDPEGVIGTVICFSLIILVRFWPRKSAQPLEGYCLQCGYNLRATPDRCPECGTVPAKNQPIRK
jgi:ABC-type Fe3+ transport system permease subunit